MQFVKNSTFAALAAAGLCFSGFASAETDAFTTHNSINDSDLQNLTATGLGEFGDLGSILNSLATVQSGNINVEQENAQVDISAGDVFFGADPTGQIEEPEGLDSTLGEVVGTDLSRGFNSFLSAGGGSDSSSTSNTELPVSSFSIGGLLENLSGGSNITFQAGGSVESGGTGPVPAGGGFAGIIGGAFEQFGGVGRNGFGSGNSGN